MDVWSYFAVTAGQITTAHRDDVGQHDVISRSQRARDECGFPEFSFEKRALRHETCWSKNVVEKNIPSLFAAQAISLPGTAV